MSPVSSRGPVAALLFTCALSLHCSGPGPSGGPGPDAFAKLPGQGSIGFDDLTYSPRLKKVIVAAGERKAVNLVDPDSLMTTVIGNMSRPESATEGGGWVFVADRGSNEVVVVDPQSGAIVAKAATASTPDYLRFSEARREVWVSEPGAGQIEVFSVPAMGTPQPLRLGSVRLPRGVEGLLIDDRRGRAYTHGRGTISVVNLATREHEAEWDVGCGNLHGIPTSDDERGLLFAGCSSARVVVLALDQDGAQLGSYSAAGGATILGYNAKLHHFYLRADPGVPVTVLGIPPSGQPELLGTVDAALRGHCLTADDEGNFWVCDADEGQLLKFRDRFPATP